MKKTNSVPYSEIGMYDMSAALAELYSEIDMLDELKAKGVQKENIERMSKSKGVATQVFNGFDYAFGTIIKIKRFKGRNAISMFQIH